MPFRSTPPPPSPTNVQVHLCIPEDQKHFVPKRRRAPNFLPANVPLPRAGELVYLSSTSAWGVSMVIHEWRTPSDLRIEVWLEHLGGGAHGRPEGFALTQ